MAKKLNCWEYFNCGREKNGLMVPFMGECSASTTMKNDGTNSGVGAGRSCWSICSDECRMAESQMIKSCFDCPFYIRVQYEEETEVPTIEVAPVEEPFEVV